MKEADDDELDDSSTREADRVSGWSQAAVGGERGQDLSDPKLRDQALRAAKSTCLNIAEAVGRVGEADKARVFAIARGEACEAAAAVDIAALASECSGESSRTVGALAREVYALLTGLIRRRPHPT